MNKETFNLFTGGLMMDLNPITTPNNVLTNCLNGTIITFNGNEHVLLNDMGNGRVETACLPEGYVPIGTCSHGGFIYIVSYNPLKNLALIGSFPSPERNIDTTELSDKTILLNEQEFYYDSKQYPIYCDKQALKASIRKTFDQVVLNPGDKFIVFAKDLYTTNLSDWNNFNHNLDGIIRDWKIRIGSIEESGKITELTNLKWYLDEETKDYYIKCTNQDLANRGDEIIDVDNYRSLVSSAYSIFSPKKSGNLCLLISPEMIDAFACTASVYKKDNKYSIFINSSWLNNKRDVNPEGIICIIENEAKNITFNNQSKFKEGKYLNPSERFNDWKDELELKVDVNRPLDYFGGKLIYRVYKDSYPELDKDNLSIYYIGVTDKNANNTERTVPSDFLNNVFNTDVSYPLIESVPIEKYQNKIVTIDVYPYMKPGYLPHLKSTLTIDFSKIGKRSVELTKWKYYVEQDNIFINWSLQAYTEESQVISKVWLEFYDLKGLVATQILEGLSSYNGDFQTRINLNRDSIYYGITGYNINKTIQKRLGTLLIEGKYNDSYKKLEDIPEDIKSYYVINPKNNNEYVLSDSYILVKLDNGNSLIYTNNAGIILSNSLYAVKILYITRNLSTFNDNESDPILVDKRWLWTIPIFNLDYEVTNDFKDLQPNLQYNLTSGYTTNSNYKEYSGLYTNINTLYGINDADIKELSTLSANVQYVRNLNPNQGNIENNLTVSLLNDYGVFVLNDRNTKVEAIIGKDEEIDDNFNREIISESGSGNLELLKSKTDNTKEITFTKELLDSLNVNGTATENINIWEENSNLGYNINKINYAGTKSTTTKDITYFTSDLNAAAVIIEKGHECVSLTVNNNKVKIPFKFEAINYSKYYHVGKVESNQELYICKSPISKIKDFGLYNLSYSPAISPNVRVFGNKSDSGEYFYNPGVCFKNILLLATYDKRNDSDKGIMRHYNITFSDTQLSLSTENQGIFADKGRNVFYLYDLYKVGPETVESIKNCFMFPVFCASTKDCADEIMPQLISNGTSLVLNCSKLPKLGDLVTLNVNTEINKYGGFLGIGYNSGIIIDFNHPIKGHENNSGAVNNPNWNNPHWSKSGYIYGNIFTYYAKFLLGLLTLIFYKTSKSTTKLLVLYDNYVYYKPFVYQHTTNMIYRVFDNSLKDIYVKFNNSESETPIKLSEFVNSFGDNKPSDITTTILENTFNFPILFNFNYIQPKLDRANSNNICILESIYPELNDKIVECQDNYPYSFVDSENKFSKSGKFQICTEGTLFITKECDSNFKIVDIDSSNTYKYKFFKLPILSYLEFVNDKLQFSDGVKGDLNKLDASLFLQNRDRRFLTGLTAINILDFEGYTKLDKTL